MRKKFNDEDQLSLLFEDVIDAVIDPVPETPAAVIAPVALAAKVAAKVIEEEMFFFITNQLDRFGGETSKIRENIAALELLGQFNGRLDALNDEHKNVLVRYTGWGGAANVFDPDTKHKAEQEKLLSLLSKHRYDAARASVLSAYYTPAAVIRAMWRGVCCQRRSFPLWK